MENRLREIIVSVTNRCNLRCKICQIPQIESNGEMTSKELKELIRDSVNLYPNSIVFSGGEPLLRKDIFELISFANQYKLNTCLTSNGTLIDNKIAKQLASSGIGVVNISIEGTEDIHNALRGCGTFQKATQALERLACNRVETTIATVVCRQNYDSLPYVMELAHQFGVTTVKFQPFSEIFLIQKEQKNDFFTSQDSLKEIERSTERVIELASKYKIATNPANYLRSIPIYLCGFKEEYSHDSCSALWGSCPISPEGNVYLCWVLSDIILGNVREKRLSQIWNSDRHNRLRQSTIKDGCLGCLMSCYDYNFGKYGLQQPFSFKIKKLKKSKFYTRQYYRIYQYLRYIVKKIINRIANLVVRQRTNTTDITQALQEIKVAKEILERELRNS